MGATSALKGSRVMRKLSTESQQNFTVKLMNLMTYATVLENTVIFMTSGSFVILTAF